MSFQHASVTQGNDSTPFIKVLVIFLLRYTLRIFTFSVSVLANVPDG